MERNKTMTKKKEQKRNIAFKVEIEIEAVAENSLFLHEHYASGTYGKDKFDVISIIPSHSLVIEVKGKRYLVPNSKVIEAVVHKATEKVKK